MPEQPIALADQVPYKKLAQAVLIQAIRDATAERRARKQQVSRSALQDRVEVKRDAGKADYFLLNDKEVFEFWCELAGLDARTVRNRLHKRLRRRDVFMMIRGYEADTHCKHGHELTPENVYINRERRVRRCRTCHLEVLRQAGINRKDRRKRQREESAA